MLTVARGGDRNPRRALAAAVAAHVALRSRVRKAETERSRILADAEREADAIRREAQVDAREQAVSSGPRSRPRSRTAGTRS